MKKLFLLLSVFTLLMTQLGCTREDSPSSNDIQREEMPIHRLDKGHDELDINRQADS